MKLSTSKVMSIVPDSIIRSASRKVLIAKKNSPTIFFVGGITGTVVSTVLACRATLKLSDTLTEIQEEVNTVKEMHENVGGATYSNDEWIKDTYYVYAKASLRLVKLYSPAIIVGVVSVGALTGSHVQLVRRNQALMVAYAALQQAYNEYRERVRDSIGAENELDIYYGVQKELVKGKDGKNELKKMVDPNQHSIYARFFDEGSRHWEKDSELNRLYVQCQQNFANNLLQVRGHIFLNEVYDMLGIERSTPGQVVGWVLNGGGDNYVSFSMFDAYNSRFVNGTERSILLDFNVDGVIYDKI